MKYLTDENLGTKVPEYLKSLGLDVISINELGFGRKDQDILKLANKQKRILNGSFI